MGWNGSLGKERNHVSMERDSGTVVDLVVVVVKEATYLRGINRSQVNSLLGLWTVWSSKEELYPRKACIRSVRSSS